jgi:hypothetical protein
MSLRIQLQRVRKRSTGRVHFTVRIPKDGPVRTLCNQTYKPGDYVPTGDDVDCRICLRRQSNEAVVSSAFFQEDLGEELLKLSLQQARERRPQAAGKSTKKTKKPPQLVVVPETEPEPPKVLGELELAGLKRVSESVYLSQSGAIIRLRKAGGGWQVEEIAFNGPIQVQRRKDDRIEVRLGDVRAVFTAKGGRIDAVYGSDSEDK